MQDTPVRSPQKRYLWQMPEYHFHYAGRPRAHQYGNAPMILFLTELSLAWGQKAGMSRPFGIGDISLADATAPPTHKTHVHGSCVDIYVLDRAGRKRSDGDKDSQITWRTADRYDAAATRELMKTAIGIIREGYALVQFLFNDTSTHNLWPGRIETKDVPPHNDHMHIQLGPEHPYGDRAEEILSRRMAVRHRGF